MLLFTFLPSFQPNLDRKHSMFSHHSRCLYTICINPLYHRHWKRKMLNVIIKLINMINLMPLFTTVCVQRTDIELTVRFAKANPSPALRLYILPSCVVMFVLHFRTLRHGQSACTTDSNVYSTCNCKVSFQINKVKIVIFRRFSL